MSLRLHNPDSLTSSRGHMGNAAKEDEEGKRWSTFGDQEVADNRGEVSVIGCEVEAKL